MIHPALKANYYECHITMEPLTDTDRGWAEGITKAFGFSIAELLMQKREFDTPERSKYDTFCTGRGYDLEDLSNRMMDVIKHLRRSNIVVWRYKIELTVIDSRYGDTMDLLDFAQLPEKERIPRDPMVREELQEAIA